VIVRAVKGSTPPTAVCIVRLERQGLRVHIAMSLNMDVDSRARSLRRDFYDLDEALHMIRSFIEDFGSSPSRNGAPGEDQGRP